MDMLFPAEEWEPKVYIWGLQLEDAKAQASVKTQPHQTGPFSIEYKD
jgi:hypothetical protein